MLLNALYYSSIFLIENKSVYVRCLNNISNFYFNFSGITTTSLISSGHTAKRRQ